MDTIEKAIQKSSTLERQEIPKQVPLTQKDAFETGEQTPFEAAVSSEAASFYASGQQNDGEDNSKLRMVNLDLERIRQAGMLVPDEKRSRIREEYRHIKRPLLMNAAGKGATLTDYANLIMVTSARSGEGKTFTAANLAISIASERDQTVLLVDADVVRPTLSQFFGLNANSGLVDFLIEDGLDLSDVLVKTDIPSLSILPAGHTHPLSTELLASNSMRQLVQNISTHYTDRIIIFDSPPLLTTSEASVLAHLVGQVVMVVEAEKTRQAQVMEALDLLGSDTIIGFVLNKTRQSMGSSYYGYGYGYGYYGHDSE